jgi:hypothetical protein
MRITIKKYSVIVALIPLLTSFALPFAGLVSAADQPPVFTLELTIIHGTASTPREKREVTKARMDAALDDKETRILLGQNGAYSSSSQNGITTDFVRNATPGFTVTAHPVPGGAELRVNAAYRVLMPVPRALTSEGVTNQTAMRGFEVNSRISLAATVGASVEVGTIDDPVSDRAWSATVTVAGVKGAVPPGTVPKNKSYIAKIDEGDGKTLRKTTLSVSGSNPDSLRVTDAVSVPYVTTFPSSGTSVQFINYPVELNLSRDQQGTGTGHARVTVARQRGTEPGRETWQVFETERKAVPGPGTALDMGSLADGGLAMHAVLEMSE